MIKRILKYGEPELSIKSEQIDCFNKELEDIVNNMFDTMYGAPGIGLAAAQIGINIRLATVDLSAGKDSAQRLVLCNPEIISDEGDQPSEEGCLSIPEYMDTISRPQKIIVRGFDQHGEEVTIEARGLLARCLSHEIDHMNGVFFIDHLSPLKRRLIRNKIKKLTKAGDW